MIRITQLKLPIDHTEQQLKQKIRKLLKLEEQNILQYTIVKCSIDARKKHELAYSYIVDVKVKEEQKIRNQFKNKEHILFTEPKQYSYKPSGIKQLRHSPVVVGAGPAGLFCTYFLAEQGYKPILIEQGEAIEDRIQSVEQFWETNQLNPNSNVQFGEGGAGTFSDGKLNTMIKDPFGRNKKVLQLLVEHGAPEEILYLNKPHIGTDCLQDVVINIRKHIIQMGAEIRFCTKLTNIELEENHVCSITVNETEQIPCEVLVLAIGHSARDTFSLLLEKGFELKQKAFAMGVRVEHLQQLISNNQYGSDYKKLPPADYKLTYQAESGRSIYSFCMCPGGFVINSSSELNGLVVNGMSNYKRNEKNANSALIVTVKPEDFDSDYPLAGVEFQKKWEKLAYDIGNGRIPIQLYEDFCNNRESTQLGTIIPNTKGNYQFANLRNCLPDFVVSTLIEGIQAFDKKIRGFANPDVLLLGVETRTSSPIRIQRDENLQSNYRGVYPCGEGAGYAGGITSAAMDGIKVYESITQVYLSINSTN